MPQMKPMVWMMIMVVTLVMILVTIIISFFTPMSSPHPHKTAPIKTMKWKW